MKKLEKVIILAFNPPYLPMIQDGRKRYEFRQKIGKDWEEGKEVYLAITKNFGGSGKVEAKFTIGRIVQVEYDNNNIPLFLREDGRKEFMGIHYRSCGWDGQKYAVEIKDFQMLDQPIELREFYNINALIKSFEEQAREDFENSSMCGAHKSIRIPHINRIIEESITEFVKHGYKTTEYNPYRIQRMPQSWCYGGVIVNE